MVYKNIEELPLFIEVQDLADTMAYHFQKLTIYVIQTIFLASLWAEEWSFQNLRLFHRHQI